MFLLRIKWHFSFSNQLFPLKIRDNWMTSWNKVRRRGQDKDLSLPEQITHQHNSKSLSTQKKKNNVTTQGHQQRQQQVLLTINHDCSLPDYGTEETRYQITEWLNTIIVQDSLTVVMFIPSKEATKILEPEGVNWYNEFISERIVSD